MNWNKLDSIYFGGDYNPDQWDEKTWDDDIDKMKELNINVVTLPVFSWSKLQPSEDVFEFGWLDRIISKLHDNGISVNLATPTAAISPWMGKKYPEILPVNAYGVRYLYGGRSNFCPNNDDYRRLSKKMAVEMAKRYSNNEAVVMWHINNEYGTYCYCETCRKKFVKWLQEKYKTLDNLNEKWYTNFWGHTYHDWDEIQVVSGLTELLPGRLGGRDGTNFQAMAVDYKRFMTESIINCFVNEKEGIKEYSNIPVTTNIWGVSTYLDLFKFSKVVDVVSWDCYPARGEHYSVAAFKHDVIRSGNKGSSFLLMEQTPNQQNWQDYNSVKRPGVMRLQSHQTLAHGADGILYFQFRQSKGACEKYHAAMVPHAGHLDTRIGRELVAFGQELKDMKDILDSDYDAKVAIMMSWENWWNVEYSSGPSIDIKYFDCIMRYYKILNELNIQVDIVEPNEDLSNYKMVVAPVLNMVSDEAKHNLESFVDNGGLLMSTYFSGIVDEFDLVRDGGYPGALKDIMGIWVEEVDALLPEETNTVDYFGEKYSCNLICEVIHSISAKTIGKYCEDFYKEFPCITENTYGKGKGIYLGTNVEEALLKELMMKYLEEVDIKAIIAPVEDVEVTYRRKDNKLFVWFMNHSDDTKTIDLKSDHVFYHNGVACDEIIINPKDVTILKTDLN